MKVGKDKVVLMHYTLKNDAGDVIDSSDGGDPLPFLQGHGNIIPGLESALEGSKVGDKLDVSIEPEEGYGLRMKVKDAASSQDSRRTMRSLLP